MLGSEKKEYLIGIENWGLKMEWATEFCRICGAEFIKRNMLKSVNDNYFCVDCKNDVVKKFILCLDEFSEDEQDLLKEINWDGELL